MINFSWPTASLAILISSLLLSALVLWRRYQSRRLLMARVQELEALSAAGREIVAAELDVFALCKLIARSASSLIDTRFFQVGLFEESLYHILYWTIDGRLQEIPRSFDLANNGGLVGWLRDSRKPLLVRDFNKELESLPARPSYINETPPRSAVFIPLISGENVIGLVSAQSNYPNHFSEEDMRRLMILANQAAAGIAHAQLFQQERKRAAHLELVSNIARELNLIRDRDKLFSKVVQLTRETFGFHPVTIFSLEPNSQQLVIQASSEPAMANQHTGVKWGEGLIGSAVAEAQTILVNNTGEDARFIQDFNDVPAEITAATQAEMAIPLIVAGEVLGALDVQSPRVGVFTNAEKTALEALAAEVATAIDQSRQLDWQREQAWITTAQFQVARALGQSVEMDELLTAVTRLTPMLVGVRLCGLLLWLKEPAIYQGSSIFGLNQAETDRFRQREFAIGDWSALDAVHVGREVISTTTVPTWLRDAVNQTDQAINRLTLLPLQTKAQWLGVMFIDNLESDEKQNGRFGPGPRRDELLQNILSQAAQAVENAYLRSAQQEEAWVNTALLQVAEAVNNLIELDEILGTIVRLVPMLVGVESAMVLTWDDERQVFTAGPSYGISAMGRGLLETLEIEQGDLPTVAHDPDDLLTPHSRYYDIQLPPWLEKVLGAPAAYAFPLNARGQRVGAIIVGTRSGSGRILSSRRLNILNGIAHQAATAVVNNQLYKESAERDRLEQEINVAREIQASLIPDGSPQIPGCSVASFWQAARQVSGDFYDFFQLSNGHWGILIADVADKGVPAALFMALSRTILRTVAFSRTDPADALMRANEIIDHDTQSDLFVTVFYAVWDPVNFTLTYANGGHNPPLLIRRSGKIRLLKGEGMALGVLPQINVTSNHIHVQSGDIFLFYTDGVTEAMNEDYDEFGMDRLRVQARAFRGKKVTAIIDSLTRAIQDHAGETPQFDDITMVVMKHDRPPARMPAPKPK